MIPYGRQDITEEDIAAVEEILRSDFLTQGPVVPRFERLVAEYCNASYAIATNSATSALHIACLALDLRSGDLVWTSPNSFVASANCARYCGADVDFVDIDPASYNMSVDALEVKLAKAKKEGRLPKILIPVHYAGQPCDMPSIRALSLEYGFKIIEDASHAIGASCGEYKVGSCAYSEITVFSFHPVKIITTGEGGMALSNDEDLAQRLRRLRSHGITSQPEEMSSRPANEIWNYQQIELGFNYRMTDIQAALGVSQLSRLDSYVRRRHVIAKRYSKLLAELPIIKPWQSPQSYSSFHLYPVRVREHESGKSQRNVYESLWDNGIAINLHYIPIHRQPYFQNLGFKAGDFPEAERFHREVISLPMYPALSSVQQRRVIAAMEIALGLV